MEYGKYLPLTASLVSVGLCGMNGYWVISLVILFFSLILSMLTFGVVTRDDIQG